jgi:hypothetical protein
LRLCEKSRAGENSILDALEDTYATIVITS